MLHLLRFLWRQSRTLLLVATVFGIASGVANVAVLGLVRDALARVDGHQRLAITFAALVVATLVTRVVSQTVVARLAQQTMSALVLQISRRMVDVPLARFEALGAGRMHAALTDDVAALTQGLLGVSNLCLNGAVVIACAAYLAYLAPAVFVVVAALVGGGALMHMVLARIARRPLAEAREQQDRLFDGFRTLTDGAKELRLYRERRHSTIEHDLEHAAAAYRRLSLKGRVLYLAGGAGFQMLLFAVVGVLLFGGPLRGDLTLPTLSAYVVILVFMMTPINVILATAPALGQARVSLQKLETLGLALQRAAVDADALRSPAAGPRSPHSIELRDVVYAYPPDAEGRVFEVGPVSLTLVPGEVVFLVGGNGSGKTTLAKVLAGLYRPTRGAVWCNGEEVGEGEEDDYRQCCAGVFADAFVFRRLPESPRRPSPLDRYLAMLQMADTVSTVDGAWSTVNLSQGQRKRLALIDACLTDRRLYVFDEWAAEQDPEFRAVFYTTVLPDLARQGKMVVVISHDDSYYHAATRVVRLERGRLQRRIEPALATFA